VRRFLDTLFSIAAPLAFTLAVAASDGLKW